MSYKSYTSLSPGRAGEREVRGLSAGVGRRCINPPDGIAHGTWGAQTHERAEGIDMDLLVTALALADGDTRVLILDIDIQILVTELADSLRQTVSEATGLPIECIRASATHTHSGPTPYKSFITQGYELVPAWLEVVKQLSAEAASEALDKLTQVIVRAGSGECYINTNRRTTGRNGKTIIGKNPDGFCDRDVLVVTFEKPSGQTIATLVNYACHPTIMGPGNRLVTPDYPGAMRRVVEGAVGGTCLFLLGAAGDQGPVIGFTDDVNVYRRLGMVLGQEAAKVALSLKWLPASSELCEELESGGTLALYDDQFAELASVPLRVMEREIAVPLRDDIPELEPAREAAEAVHAELHAAQELDDEETLRIAIVKARRADLKLRLAEDFQGRTDIGIRTHFICFGDVALVAANIEPFAATGVSIKQESPFPATLVSGYTNGRLAYMATAEEWKRGGHEVINSPFGQPAADVFEREVLGTLRMLRQT